MLGPRISVVFWDFRMLDVELLVINKNNMEIKNNMELRNPPIRNKMRILILFFAGGL